ncbi:MAG: SIMPL domain-containing protein [Pseudomonadota bacterium]|nr:SIMPL domain-containing protein [Pseudomonadota bacterium]
MRVFLALASLSVLATPAAAQQGASLNELATTPVVTVRIGENLKVPPDEATITVTTTSRAPTASGALEAYKVKTEKMVESIRAAGIGARDIQTQGVNLHPDYQYYQDAGRGNQRLVGYVASNSVTVKTRRIDRLSSLLDQITAAGADQIYGPNFGIADPLPLRREARKRAMARGEAEAMEYAANAGFNRVRLLTVEEGVSYRSSDIVVTGSRISQAGAPPPPPPPQPERGGIEPGQIETGVQLTLVYRMER